MAKSRNSPWKHKREAEGCAGPLPPASTGAAASTRASFGSPPWSIPQASPVARRAPSPAATKILSVLRIAGVSVEEPMPWRLQEIFGGFEGRDRPGGKFFAVPKWEWLLLGSGVLGGRGEAGGPEGPLME